LPDVRIMVLDGARADVVPALVTHRLTPVLNALEEISAYAVAARGGKLDAALQVDTGISRSGLSREAIGEVGANATARLANINLVMILSQLACADEPEHPQNARQLARFREALAVLPTAPASLAASAGVHLGRDYIFDAVRPGVALYGGNPVPTEQTPYRPVAKLAARVLQVRDLEQGGTVGYGATFTAAKPTRLAIVALGYADGFPRLLQTHGTAAVNGMRVPFAGRISMDLMALDISALAPGSVKPGTEVEFIGDTITVDDVAAAVGTIPHEVLNWLSHPRAQRVYEG
jgi:alanine racemase